MSLGGVLGGDHEHYPRLKPAMLSTMKKKGCVLESARNREFLSQKRFCLTQAPEIRDPAAF